jgi:hypothetical protein
MRVNPEGLFVAEFIFTTSADRKLATEGGSRIMAWTVRLSAILHALCTLSMHPCTPLAYMPAWRNLP